MVDQRAKRLIGIDLGGTKIEAAILEPDGSIRERQRVATPRENYRATLQSIRVLVERLEAGLGEPASVGIGTPGAISPASGLIKNSNSVWLNDRPLAEDLEQVLGRKLRFANDADCFTLSEAVDGAAAGAGCVFGVILGTGVGGGIVVEGRLLRGPNAISGEWGHNPLPWPREDEWPGPPCYCGKTGCIEQFLAGPGLARGYHELTGADLLATEVVRRAETGEAEAEQVLQQYEERLARALAGLLNILDPDLIVLGGGLSNLERLYASVPELWGPYVFSDRVDSRLVPPKHGDSSGVRGAARLWDNAA